MRLFYGTERYSNGRLRMLIPRGWHEAARKPKNVEAELEKIVDRIWRLGEELKKARPAKLRELFRQMVERFELRFDHVQRGKRLECPLAFGKIHLKTVSSIFCGVSRAERI